MGGKGYRLNFKNARGCSIVSVRIPYSASVSASHERHENTVARFGGQTPSEDDLSDLDIARQATLARIADLIADRLGIDGASIETYGHYKAKLPLDVVDSLAGRPDGKLVLVTALSPTPAGEGKTTTTIGLGDGSTPSAGRRSSACASHRSDPVLAPKEAPRAAGTRKSCRWKTSISISPEISTR